MEGGWVVREGVLVYEVGEWVYVMEVGGGRAGLV